MLMMGTTVCRGVDSVTRCKKPATTVNAVIYISQTRRESASRPFNPFKLTSSPIGGNCNTLVPFVAVT